MKTLLEQSNRTGLAASPLDSEELLELMDPERTPLLPPKEEWEAPTATELRIEYQREAAPLGSMPRPATIKGMFGTVMQALAGNRQHVLLDKLAERAAFERTGTRLYEAALRKFAVLPLPDGVPFGDLQEIRDDEARHYLLLVECIEQLGGDPTAQTPCADAVGVQGMGLLQLMGDPRTSAAQALQTLLAAELIDNASWELLISLASEFGLDEMRSRFQAALESEESHLLKVKSWVSLAVTELATGAAADAADSTPHGRHNGG